MKSIIAIVKSEYETLNMQNLSNLARQIESDAIQYNAPIERLNAGAYIIPWSNGLKSLNIVLSAASQRGFVAQLLPFDDTEWIAS